MKERKKNTDMSCKNQKVQRKKEDIVRRMEIKKDRL